MERVVYPMTLDRREKLKTVFENTMQAIRYDSALSAATEKGIAATRLYGDGYLPVLPLRPEQKAGIAVTKARTLEAAMRIRKKHPDWRVCALNFVCLSHQSRRRCKAGLQRPGGVPLPLHQPLSYAQPEADVGWILQ